MEKSEENKGKNKTKKWKTVLSPGNFNCAAAVAVINKTTVRSWVPEPTLPWGLHRVYFSVFPARP